MYDFYNVDQKFKEAFEEAIGKKKGGPISPEHLMQLLRGHQEYFFARGYSAGRKSVIESAFAVIEATKNENKKQ